MNVLICELEFPTHYHFIQHLLPHLSSRFDGVAVAVMEDADQDLHYLNTIRQHESLANVEVFKLFETVPRISDRQAREREEGLARERNFEKLNLLLERRSAEHFVTLSGDKLIPMIARRQAEAPNSPLATMSLHLGVHWLLPVPLPHHVQETGQLNPQQRRAQALLSISPATLMFQNDLALQNFRQYVPELAERCFWNPIPIEVFEPVTKEVAREHFGLPWGGRLIGFAGSIQHRKGIPLFLSALREAHLEPEDRVLLIGPFDDHEISGLIKNHYQDLVADGRLLLRDEKLDAYSIHLAVSAFDVLVCNLSNHQWSSDMALRAIVAERPILASDEKWFRYMNEKFSIGTLVPEPRDEKSIAKYIEQSLQESGRFRADPLTAQLKALNHPDHYASVIMEAMFNKPLPKER